MSIQLQKLMGESILYAILLTYISFRKIQILRTYKHIGDLDSYKLRKILKHVP